MCCQPEVASLPIRVASRVTAALPQVNMEVNPERTVERRAAELGMRDEQYLRAGAALATTSPSLR
jgi:hypothetical protein